MTYALMVFVLLAYSFLDSAQDKLNSAKNKRPYSHYPWPLVDKWHLIKHLRMYLPVLYILALWRWPGLLPSYPGDLWGVGTVAVLALAGKLVWAILPRPKHWR